MKTRLIANAAAVLLAGTVPLATAAPAASPVAGIPVLGGLLGSLTAGLPAGGSAPGSLPGLAALGSLPLPALPLGAVAAPFAGLPVLGPMAVQGAANLSQSVPSLVNLLLNVVVNLPGLGNSLMALGAGGVPALSPAVLAGLPGKLGPASTDLLQAINSSTAQYGLPVLPTTLPGL